MTALTEQFRSLHTDGIFVMPNAWDAGSGRYLAALGFAALATTSSGHAATLGRPDQAVTRDEMLAHAEMLVSAVSIPVSVDSERCFGEDPDGVAETVRLIAATGAAGCSIEDWDPGAARIDPVDVAAERVQAAVEAAQPTGMVVTARAENHLYGVTDLDDTIGRLQAYRDAGADVVYAPGLVEMADISRVVTETGMAVNVLALADAPSIAELTAAGVRRVSTGGAFSRVAFGALDRAARELRHRGTYSFLAEAVDHSSLNSLLAAHG